MSSITNPGVSFVFCPDQTELFCFQAPDGFSAIELNMIEGFTGTTEEGRPITSIHTHTNNVYQSTEAVPVLVNRYADMKRRRYEKDRPANTSGSLGPSAAAAAARAQEAGAESGLKVAPTPVGGHRIWEKE